MHVPVSLSFSIYICKNGLDPDQTRMEFRKECFVNLKKCACDRKYAKCSTKANAYDKVGFQYISISVYIVRSHARIQRGDRGSEFGYRLIRSESMQSINTVEYPTLSCKSRCTREASSAPIHDIFRDYKRFVCKR